MNNRLYEAMEDLTALKTVYGLSQHMLDSIDLGISAIKTIQDAKQGSGTMITENAAKQAIERHIQEIEKLLNL